jgi:Mg2+-importing ATPase
LTDGRITFEAALDASGAPCPDALVLGLVCNEAVVDGHRAVSGNQLDAALWNAAGNEHEANAALGWQRVFTRPFDHDRRLVSVLADPPSPDAVRTLIVKGEPEGVLARCAGLSASASGTLARLFGTGARVIAVASRPAAGATEVDDVDEQRLELRGFLVFADRPKADARESIARLARLGIAVKVITGDSERVAVKVCRDLGLDVAGSLTGAQVNAMTDAELGRAIDATSVFARVDPATKARIVRIQRTRGEDVAFLGDGVNDAVALHDADVGISVDTATDVAKDAADVLLLDKDLGVLADGVVEGRRIFANTVKYVLMATSSNFGNMFSAAGASAFLSFLPMLPSQILLNNLLYDTSQMTIPTDHVDEEMLARPSAWDVRFIRRFMTFFGPLSSVFDFATFAVLLGVLHAGATEFRTGWFVESLATQTLVIFVIRTRRSPFWLSRPSRPLLVASLVVPLVGLVLPYTTVADDLGFRPLPFVYFVILIVFVAAYLALVEVAKRRFYAVHAPGAAIAQRRPHRERRILRRAARFSRRHRVTRSRRRREV